MAIRKAAPLVRAFGSRRPGRSPRRHGRLPRPRFTGRAAVLVLVLCSLVAALAYPTRQFIAQRADIAAQRAAADQARARGEELRREKARWQDPAYIRAQARERLHFAMPGETPYVSVDPAARAKQSVFTAPAPLTEAAPAPAAGTAARTVAVGAAHAGERTVSRIPAESNPSQ